MKSLAQYVASVVAALLLTSLSFVPELGMAQVQQAKPARVAEVENLLTKDATQFLKTRFPDKPFLVWISIDPLRRDAKKNNSRDEANRRLPYFDDEVEDIQDEWDDPAVSPFALLALSKKIVVRVSVPSSFTDEETAEIQSTMMQILNLVPSRDEVTITKRNWSVNKPDPTSLSQETVFLVGLAGLAAIFFGLLGLLYVIPNSMNKVASSVSGAVSKLGGTRDATPVSLPAPPNAEPIPSRASSGAGLAGDVNFHDPIRIREVIALTVRDLVEHPSFPVLEDMIQLDRLGQEDPAALGALLAELPTDVQSRLFSQSEGPHWLAAMADPGPIGPLVLERFSKLGRITRSETDRSRQKALINVWRLNDDLPAFLKSIEIEDAFAILHCLPKNMAVSSARDAFPGLWGRLLSPRDKIKTLTPENWDKLAMKALQIKPYRDASLIEKHKSDRALLDLLQVADPAQEREIYGASPTDSILHAVRPPFFPFLELGTDEMRALVSKLSLDEWAFALHNLTQSERKGFIAALSDKQRFLLVEKWKRMETIDVDSRAMGRIREKVGKLVAQMKQVPNASVAPSSKEGESDVSQRAA